MDDRSHSAPESQASRRFADGHPRVKDHVVTVTGGTDLTPWYRRLTFDPAGLFEVYHPSPASYLLLNLDDPGRGSPVQRSYSVCQVSPTSFALEFVLHPGPGPASAWAAQAHPGSTLSVSEPAYHMRLPELDYGLLIADASAFAAISSLLVAIEPGIQLDLLLLDPHPDREQISLPIRDNTTITWADCLDEDRLRGFTHGIDPAQVFLWGAGERQCAKAIREFVRQEFPVPRTAQHIQTYWIAPDPVRVSGEN